MAAQPATVAPASNPAPAKEAPASAVARPVPAPAASNILACPFPYNIDAKANFPHLDEKAGAEFMREVVCYVACDVEGTVQYSGRFFPFKLAKATLVKLPKYFALSHPSRYVIKE